MKESDLAMADSNPYVQKVREYVQTHLACDAVVISAQIESDLVDLSPEEGKPSSRSLREDLAPSDPRLCYRSAQRPATLAAVRKSRRDGGQLSAQTP